MRYVWIAIIAASATPLAYVAWLANPLSFLIYGPDSWREQMMKLRPYRWQIAFLILVCVFSVAVYTISYA